MSNPFRARTRVAVITMPTMVSVSMIARCAARAAVSFHSQAIGDAEERQRCDELATRRRAPTPPERERAGHGGQHSERQRGERDQPAALGVAPPEPPPADYG